LRSGLLQLEQLQAVALFARHADEVRAAYPAIGERRLVHETVRRMINALTVDLVDETRRRIAAAGVADVDDVRAAPPLVAFSDAMRRDADALKRFLMRALYRHERVNRMMAHAQQVVRDLFAAYRAAPDLLPPDHRARIEADGLRAIADYVAGMTDRFALREHRRLCGGDGDPADDAG